MNIIPTEFDIHEMNDNTDISIKDEVIQSKGNTTLTDTGNRVLEFELPRENFLYSAESYLTFKVQLGTTGFIDDWNTTMIQNIQVLVGNLEIENIEEFGFHRAIANNHTYDYDTRYGASGLVRGANSSTFEVVSSPRKLIIPLYDIHSNYGFSNFFKDLLPLYKMDTIKIKITLNPNKVQYTELSPSSVTITNPLLFIRLIDSESLRKEYENPIKRSFLTHHHYLDNVINTQTKLSTIIPFNNISISGVLITQRPSSILSDASVNSKYTARFTISNATKYNIIIDGKSYPKIPYSTDDGVELIQNLEKYWNVAHLGSYISSSGVKNHNTFGSYSHTDDSSTQYLHNGIELRMTLAIPFDNSKNIIFGMDGTKTSGTAKLNVEMAAIEAAQVDIFVKYNKFYTIGENGDFKIKC